MKKIVIIIIALAILSIPVSGMLRDRKNPEVTNYQSTEQIEQEEVVESEEESGVDYRDYIRNHSGGSVDVAIVLKNIVEDNDENLMFELMLNTHSVDLENINYENKVNLKTDKFNINEGFSWQLTGGGGHHLSGELTLSKKYNGENIIDENTQFVEIEIQDLGGVESRTFSWKKDDLKNIK
ncbi:hypothetical protein [Senegalia massiliensis]|uniref:hypothetical protein n=1 Tax=Senegalia massiliensis TaxID=1720316 RepID=UPI0010321882|nr:hypothetical protein [Senegalia massiliensis]